MTVLLGGRGLLLNPSLDLVNDQRDDDRADELLDERIHHEATLLSDLNEPTCFCFLFLRVPAWKRREVVHVVRARLK
jgi:hypothetical protein